LHNILKNVHWLYRYMYFSFCLLAENSFRFCSISFLERCEDEHDIYTR